MLTMTCQSSLLIRVLNELFLPGCTLEFDFQLPRQLQFIWLHARETGLPYFSGSTALLKGRDTVLKKSVYLFHFILLFSIRWHPSISSANDLTDAQKRHPKYHPLYLCRRRYEVVLQHHAVLKCHIRRLRS